MINEALMATLIAAIFLALVHVLADKFQPERIIRQKYWLSFADGISISYVCLRLLPEVAEGFQHFPETLGAVSSFLKHSPFFPLLMGLVAFSGLERLVERPSELSSHGQSNETSGLRIWSHLASYAIYKGLIGYLLAQIVGILAVSVFTVSMAMHFLVVDYRLLKIHKSVYQRLGRWLLSFAIIIGWTIGVTTDVSPFYVSLMLSFVAGGIVLVVLEEEFSKDHPKSFVAFFIAVMVYFALQLIL